MQQAALLVAHVLDGGNLTDLYESTLRENPQWSDATRGAIRDLSWSTLREFGRGDALLVQFLHKPLPIYLHALLLVSLYRLEQRPAQSHTLVDQAVDAAAAVYPALKGVVNGVLRNVMREAHRHDTWRSEDIAARYAYPQWWINRVRRDHPQGWERILEAGNLHPPMALRVNARMTSPAAVLETLDHAGIPARVLDHGAVLLQQPIPVARLPGFTEGRLSVQDAGAQWAGVWLDAKDGERILDACAAPGGKTAHILERADVELTALELDPVRAARVRLNLDRLGLKANIKVADCRKLSTWWDGKPFDRILADVPCSASGVVRRHPDIKWLRREEDIAGFVHQQAEIIDALWQTLAPGGTMLYVTCSVFADENHRQIAAFRARHPDAEPYAIEADEACFLPPTADHDGFFYARLRKHC
ncbi:16S rRNA (cytosine(967)-C(5))-methyltransferase RsmB [Azoarcus sp. L1K30]|uniref:16S rRNA (cytosine(967)-C(5))-methyltransferase RsmB n=1 Tax=Azoarcus sp. L1K30 TaxID=2820277 RepID=UPI0020114230|nr:16S rRNA (cytosine(967)-C(5))-methyltransferase RsmB [Azoarcus sp. L1K30]